MGVTEVDTMLMILGVSRDMNDLERDVVTTQLIHGFNDLAREAGTNVTGGQTVMNPWPIVGGVAMSVRQGRLSNMIGWIQITSYHSQYLEPYNYDLISMYKYLNRRLPQYF